MRRIDVGVLRVVVAGHLVGPVEDLVAVLLRHAEQFGDRLQRKLARHLVDEVAGALGRGGLDDLLRALARVLAQLLMARGVKPRETILRSLVCCGASLLSRTKRCISICSRVMSVGKRRIAVFSEVEKTSLRRDTSLTSACLVTTQ